MPKIKGLFKVLERVGDNTYKLEELKVNSFQEKHDDARASLAIINNRNDPLAKSGVV